MSHAVACREGESRLIFVAALRFHVFFEAEMHFLDRSGFGVGEDTFEARFSRW